MTPAGWRTFYDGQEFNSRTHRPDQLPDGIVSVMVYYQEQYVPGKPYRDTVSGGDWYYFHADGRVTHSGTQEEWDVWRPSNPPDGAVAVRSTGRLTDERYNEIVDQGLTAELAP